MLQNLLHSGIVASDAVDKLAKIEGNSIVIARFFVSPSATAEANSMTGLNTHEPIMGLPHKYTPNFQKWQ